MAQTLMMKELHIHIGGNTMWVSHDKAKLQKIREHSNIIWLGKYNLLYLAKTMILLIDPVDIYVTNLNDLSLFKIVLECCWNVLLLHNKFSKCIFISNNVGGLWELL